MIFPKSAPHLSAAFAVLWVLCALSITAAHADPTADYQASEPASDFSKLIADLGDDDFHVRAAAQKKLDALLPEAVPGLEKLIASDSLPVEVRLRLENAIPRIRRRASASLYETRMLDEISWLRESARQAYEHGGHMGPAWDQAALRAFSLVIRPRVDRTRTPRDDAAALAALTLAHDLGCNDPLLAYELIHYLRVTKRISQAEAAERLDPVVDSIVSERYPPFWQLQAALFRAEQLLPGDRGTLSHKTKRKIDADLQTAERLLPAINSEAGFPHELLLPEVERLAADIVGRTQQPEKALQQVRAAMRAAGADEKNVLVFEADHRLKGLAGDFDWCSMMSPRGTTERTKRDAVDANAAAECLTRAWELDKSDPAPPTLMVRVARYKETTSDEMNRWFNRAMAAYGNNFDACSNKLQYLLNNNTTPEEVLSFGRDCLQSGNWQGRLPFILVDAHLELSRRVEGGPTLADPAVWSDISQVYEQYLTRYPASASDRSFYTYLACMAHKWDVANRQFAILGDDAVVERFRSGADYRYWKRKAAAATQPALPAQMTGGQ